jgi:hypothetical protein
MVRRSTKNLKKENTICDRIRKASEEFEQLSQAGEDTTEALQRLVAALEDYEEVRRINPLIPY